MFLFAKVVQGKNILITSIIVIFLLFWMSFDNTDQDK